MERLPTPYGIYLYFFPLCGRLLGLNAISYYFLPLPPRRLSDHKSVGHMYQAQVEIIDSQLLQTELNRLECVGRLTYTYIVILLSAAVLLLFCRLCHKPEVSASCQCSLNYCNPLASHRVADSFQFRRVRFEFDFQVPTFRACSSPCSC